MHHPESTKKETKIQAARLHAARDLRLERSARPNPGPGEVLIRLAAVGVCGSDVHYYLDGRIGDQVAREPIILGHEIAGWVAEAGPGVEGLNPDTLVAVEPAIHCGVCERCRTGDPNLCPDVRFCGTPPIDGAFTEYMIMPAENCFPVPETMSPEEAALLEPLGVAIHAVDLAHLRPGSTVAVLGAGPIGLLTARVAKFAGAAAVFMSEPLPYRRAFAASYAAEAVFDPGSKDVAAEIQALTDGRGVDVAFEAAGDPGTPQQAAEAVRPGGRVILIGIPSEDQLEFKASTVRRKGLTISVSRRMKHTYPRAIRMVTRGQVDLVSLVSHRHPLAEIGTAFEQVAGYSDGVLRAVITMGE